MARKNKGKFGKGKPQVEETDEFISGVNKVFTSLRPHVVPLAVVGGLVTAGLVGWTVYTWHGERKEKRATEAYAGAMAVSRAPVVDPDIGAPPVVPGGASDQTFATAQERRQAAIAALSSVTADHGDVDTSNVAEVTRARLLLEDGQFDSALTAYRELASSSVAPVLREVALEGAGYALEGKAMAAKDPAQRQSGLEEALKAFEQIQTDPAQPGHALSLYHKGRVLTALGKSDEALKTFKQLLVDHADSGFSDDVNNRIAMIEQGSGTP